MTDLTRLDHRLDAETLTCHAIIETPKGQRGKLPTIQPVVSSN